MNIKNPHFSEKNNKSFKNFTDSHLRDLLQNIWEQITTYIKKTKQRKKGSADSKKNV